MEGLSLYRRLKEKGHRLRESPGTEAELDDYAELINRKAGDFWPLLSCSLCDAPIGEVVYFNNDTWEPPLVICPACHDSRKKDGDV